MRRALAAAPSACVDQNRSVRTYSIKAGISATKKCLPSCENPSRRTKMDRAVSTRAADFSSDLARTRQRTPIDCSMDRSSVHGTVYGESSKQLFFYSLPTTTKPLFSHWLAACTGATLLAKSVFHRTAQ